MDNNTNHTTAAAAGEKKNSVKALLEKGKSTGKLTTQEIDAAIVEEDFLPLRRSRCSQCV
jgi:hypothetical protein